MNDRKKKILTISVFVYAIVFLFIIFMMNFEKFSGFTRWVNEKLDVFTPIILGAIFAYICTPLVKFFQKTFLKKISNNRVKRNLSVILAYVLLLGLIIVFVFMIFPQLIASIEDLMRKLTDGTYMDFAVDKVNKFLGGILPGDDNAQFLDKDKIINAINNFFMGSENFLHQGLNFVFSYGAMLFTGLKNIFFGLLLSIYFVLGKEKIYAQSKKIISALFTKKRCDAIVSWFRFADKTFGGFIIGKLLDALFMIFTCSIAFSFADVPYPLLIAVFIGVCNIIPFFGPFIGIIPSGLIILIANPSKLIIFSILILIIQQFDANVVEPKLLGSRTGLSSLGVMVAIMIMSGYFGLIGMFFGVPIFAIIYASVRGLVDAKLKKKALSTDLADYYSENAIITPKKKNKTLSSRVFGFFSKKIVDGEHKVVDMITKKKDQPCENEECENDVASGENATADNCDREEAPTTNSTEENQ